MELKNAKREIFFTTHTPIDPHQDIPLPNAQAEETARLADLGPVTLARAALLHSFRLKTPELSEALEALKQDGQHAQLAPLLEAMLSAAKSPSPTQLITELSRIKYTMESYRVFVQWLLQWHRAKRHHARKALETLVEQLETQTNKHRVDDLISSVPQQPKPSGKRTVVKPFEKDLRTLLTAQLIKRQSRRRFGIRLRDALTALQSTDGLTALEFLRISIPSHFEEQFAQWTHFEATIQQQLSSLADHSLGYLHLERMSYIPAGIEHGELVASIPLAPGESVHIVHKEWTNTSEEFHKLVKDSFEDYSENGVIDKTDLSESSRSQASHSSNMAVSVSVSGGFGSFFQSSAQTTYQTQSAASNSRARSLSRSKAITQKASSRSKREHQYSFKLATKSHIEDQTVRTIKNPDPINPVRFDYHQLMRKWRVDVHRYGIRLTFDFTLPEPAKDLLRPYRELAQIEDRLEKGFRVDFELDDIDEQSYTALASRYGAPVSPPPAELSSIQITKYYDDDATPPLEQTEAVAFKIQIPEGYRFEDVSFGANLNYGGSGKPELVVFTPDHVHPVRSAIHDDDISSDDGSMIIVAKLPGNLENIDINEVLLWATVVCTLTDDGFRQWQLDAYQKLREAAQKQFSENRQFYEERRTRLLSHLQDQDALTLRKIEREELMKAVLRWAFPQFSSESILSLEKEGVQGKIISFLHQAIEWENINYFLYPYFWGNNQPAKLQFDLRHEDATHEAFLRAGAARVFLTIRPEWEEPFLSFITNGFEGLDNHVYLTIVDQVHSAAKESYPGIVPANDPSEIDPDLTTKQAEGIHIGSWYEYTPTSALDIRIGESIPSEGEDKTPTYDPPKGWTSLIAVLNAVKNLVEHVTDGHQPSESSPSSDTH